MARTARNAKLDTRSARSKLPPRREPYWTTLATGQALGYRRLDRNRGTWIARAYDDGTRTRRYHALGDADDVTEADGRDVLTFGQAQAEARAWFPKARFGECAVANSSDSSGSSPEEPPAPKTVAEAMAVYCAYLDAHKKPTTAAMVRHQARHINAALGALRLNRLTANHIGRWRDTMATTAAKGRPFPADPEELERAKRQRRATANRALTTLKAALRHTESKHPGTLPDKPWEGAEPFKGANAARVRFLTRDECKRLLNASPPDLRRLVRAALLSGCRYGELCRLKVGDFHPESGTLHIAVAKAGARTIPLDDEARAFFAAVTAGRGRGETMLVKDDGQPWKRDDQARPMRAASDAARLDPPATVHVLRHTYASLRIMAGAPLPAIANALGHSSTRMVEEHYGHLAPSWVADAIRATALGIGSGEEAEKVARLAS